MIDQKEIDSHHAMLPSVFQQNWENVRHIKYERLMFTNIYAIITAGVLSLLNSVKGHWEIEILLIAFLWFFSMIGLLTSFRLKAELEECLANIEKILVHVGLAEFMAMGGAQKGRIRFPKFRWVFPIFYSVASATFLALLVYRLIMPL